MQTHEILELHPADLERLQYRGSYDGIVWCEWCHLLCISAAVQQFSFYQARIWVDGEWRVSPVSTDD